MVLQMVCGPGGYDEGGASRRSAGTLPVVTLRGLRSTASSVLRLLLPGAPVRGSQSPHCPQELSFLKGDVLGCAPPPESPEGSPRMDGFNPSLQFPSSASLMALLVNRSPAPISC